MSRSWKHTPRSGDRKSKIAKQQANRRLRRQPLDNLPLNHKSYKKAFCSYDICDYQEVGTTFEDYWKGRIKWWYAWRQYHNEPFPNREQVYKEYLKWFIRK